MTIDPATLPGAELELTGSDSLADDFDDDRIDPEVSWVLYENAIRVETSDGIAVHLPLPAQAPVPESPTNNYTEYQGGSIGDGYRVPYQPSSPSNGPVIQFRAPPVIYVVLIGRAVRAGFEIPAPQVLRVGGQKAYPVNDPSMGHHFTCKQIALAPGNVPIFGASWRLRWVVSGIPDDVIHVPHDNIINDATEATGE